MEIKKVGVLGCGLMGSGIAQVAATAGFDVTVLEVEQKYLDKGFAGIEKSLAKFSEKGTLKESPQVVRGRLVVNGGQGQDVHFPVSVRSNHNCAVADFFVQQGLADW